jgi:hypothetical protein
LWADKKIYVSLTLQKPDQSITKIGLKALQTNKLYLLLTLFFLLGGFLMYGQEGATKKSLNIEAAKDTLKPTQKLDTLLVPLAKQDTIKTDSVPKKKEGLLGKVKYKAVDYVKINQKEKKIYLYNQAEVYYQDTELKAGIIILDYEKNEVYAGRIKDSTGAYTQLPDFKQGANQVQPDSIRFNYDTKKALIWNSRSEQQAGGTMNVFAEITKKENDSVYFLNEIKLTTAKNIDDPEYYIRIRKGKLVPKKKIIAGLSNMYIADVPTPIGVPFAYFPMTENRTSGFIFPTFGENNNRGYFLQNGGYYFAVSDYFDLAVLGDIYTNGSYALRTETNYALRYKFRGSLRVRYENLINSQKGFDDYSRNSIYNIQWSHNQDPKANPNSRFSASVNLGSSRYFQQSVNQLNTPNFLNNTLSSSISYSKTFPEYPSVNLSLTARHSQNTRTESIDMTLPSLQANLERIFPFAKRSGPKKGIIQNINFQYNLAADNRIQTTDSLFFKKEMFDDAKIGARHSIPISTNFKLFKHFSVSVGGNYEDVWTFKTIRRNDYDATLQEATVDTLNGFDRFNKYNLSASLGTTLYGTFNFGEDKKIQAIRHVMRPAISWGYTPGFDQYYDEYIASEDPTDIREYTRFERLSIFGTPSRGNANSMGISINNTLEAKVRDKDTTKLEPKKIKLLNSLNFSTSYNFNADSLAWSPVRVTGGTQLFDNKMSINFGATLDPYAIDNNGTRMDVFNIDNGGSLFRLTNANINLSYSLNSKTFSTNNSDNRETDNSQSGGRNDDLFGKSQDFADRSNDAFGDLDDNQETSDVEYYKTKLPWDLRFAYSMTYSNNRRQNEITNSSLMFSGNIELSPKWKVGASSGYDFKNKGFTYTQLRFERDLDSWRLNFNWVPFSSRASWYFFIGIKSGLLSDIKWEKRSEPDRRL